MANDETVRTRDVLPVYSRISWGAILAGLFVTLAVFVLLSTLGLATGISAADEANRDNVTVGAGIWAVITALIAFFCGGCVVSRFTAGETKAEAVMYGTVLWGASFALILWATGTVLRTGTTLAVGSANVAANAATTTNLDQAMQRANLTPEQMNQMRAQMPTAGRVQDVSAQAAWWSFLGVVLSLGAAIGGALASAGPNPVFGGVLFRRTTPEPTPGV
jgi:flagellar biosynthesis component FlhA